MGQAVDLPDPMQSPAASAAAASADDLLSQLASEEIDRLLAESDAELALPPADAPAPPTAQASAPPAVEERESSSLDTVLTEASTAAPPASSVPPSANEASSITEPSAPPDATASATTKSSNPAISAAIAALDAKPLNAKALDDSLAAQPKTASDAVHAAVTEIETTLEERGGLTDSSAGGISLDATDDDTPIPAYLKPLVWLNAPMMLLPESIRDALGKIAILTLFNAVAIFAYVLLFRGHHH